MPFKVKLIKNFQKYLANSHISPEEDKRGSHLTTSESIDKQKYWRLDIGLNIENSSKKTTVCTKWPSEKSHLLKGTLLTFSTYDVSDADGDLKLRGHSV